MAGESFLVHINPKEIPQLKTCPAETTFKILGKTWMALIFREMLGGVTQFNRLLENVGGITSRVLSQRLRELQRLGIAERRIVSEAPTRAEYRLTNLGQGLEPILCSAVAFSMIHLPGLVFTDGRPRHPERMFGWEPKREPIPA